MYGPMDDADSDELTAEPATVFGVVIVCAGKEYILGRLLRRLLDQELGEGLRLHVHCIFDGPAKIAELWWNAFADAAEARGISGSVVTVELHEREGEHRFERVGRLRQIGLEECLEGSAEYLWWVECDCPPPAHAAATLVGRGVPLVSAAVADRSGPGAMNWFTLERTGGKPSDLAGMAEGELLAVSHSGLSCSMMTRDAVERSGGWPDGWEADRGDGGEDGYLQRALVEAVGCEVLIDPAVLVTHWDVDPRLARCLIRHRPHRIGGGRVGVAREHLAMDDVEGSWRPRAQPWHFRGRWRDFVEGDPVPVEFRERVAERYSHMLTGTGSELPECFDLSEHELLLPGEAAHISGKYQGASADGQAVGDVVSVQRGVAVDADDSGTEPAAYDLVEIEVI